MDFVVPVCDYFEGMMSLGPYRTEDAGRKMDVIQFGMIPEIVGRLPIITNTNYLDKKSLEKILTEPQNAIIKQYQKLFSYSNVELTFTKGAIERLAEYAEALQTGARGLRTCVGRAWYDLASEIW